MPDLGYRPPNFDQLINRDGRCRHLVTGATGDVISYSPALGGYLVEWRHSGSRDWVRPDAIEPGGARD